MYIGDNGSCPSRYLVSAAQGQNRLWRYTSLTTLAPNTTRDASASDLVGWEWDGARPSNGAEPAGRDDPRLRRSAAS